VKRSGQFVKNLPGKAAYHSFKPAPLPPKPDVAVDDSLDANLKKAHRLLGKLDAASNLLPDKELFISMYVRKEALLSSQIEGTQATLDDIFNPHLEKNKNQDVEEVIRYLQALTRAHELSDVLPLSVRSLKEVHAVLLSSIRGKDKEPGQVRQTQNWIGPPNATIENATFIPPNVNDMKEALTELEKYIHNESRQDPLIKIALIHYQFVTIHPFLDGNGRIGRLLAMLLLRRYKLLEHDTLYLSYYLKKNRREYYDRLTDVRLKGHYEEWVSFFVKGMIESAKHALACIEAILQLRERNMKRLDNKFRGQQKKTAQRLFHHLEAQPIIDIPSTSKNIGKAFNTVAKMVEAFVDLGLLQKVGGDKRYRVYAYEEYLKILRDGTE